MLTGAGLPERVTVQWEIAHDEAFTRIAARGEESAELAWAHSVHAEAGGAGAGALVLVPLHGARPAQHGRPHAHRAGRRCRGRVVQLRDRQLPALGRGPLRRLAPRRRRRPRPGDVPRRLHLRIRLAAEGGAPGRGRPCAHARRVPRALRHAQERPGPAGRARRRAVAAGVGRPRGRQRLRQPAGAGAGARLQGPARRRLPRLLGAHAVPEVGAPGRCRHAHRRPARLGPAGAHPPARRPPVPRRAGLPEARPRRLEHRGAEGLPRVSRHAPHAARRRAGALARRRLGPRPPVEPARAADADGALLVERPGRRAGGGTYWTDGWDGYPAARASACSARSRSASWPASSCSAATSTATTSPT